MLFDVSRIPDPFDKNVSYGALKASLCRAIEGNESQNGDERRAFPLDTICDLHKRKVLRKEVKVSIDELEQKITRSSQEDNFQGSNLIYRKFKDSYDVAQIFFGALIGYTRASRIAIGKDFLRCRSRFREGGDPQAQFCLANAFYYVPHVVNGVHIVIYGGPYSRDKLKRMIYEDKRLPLHDAAEKLWERASFQVI